MTGADVLVLIREMDIDIAVLQAARARAFAAATSTTRDPAQEPSHGHADPHRFDRCAEISEAIEKKISEQLRLKLTGLRVIQALDDPLERVILIAYYLDARKNTGELRTWAEIAQGRGIALRSCMTAKAKAMQELALIRAGDVSGSDT